MTSRDIIKRTRETSPTPPAPPRMPIGHILKTWPEEFEAVSSDRKRFEVRKDDRDFQTGDTVVFTEFDPDKGVHSGRYCSRQIGLLGRGKPYPDGYCAFELTYGEVCPTTAGVACKR